jgi:hypothetical protein
MTYFTSLNYTNYTLVTDWFVAGNEIADHTSVAVFYAALFTIQLTIYQLMIQNDPRRHTPC